VIDIEALLTTYLKAETGERIVGETPTSTGSPWVKITLIDTDDRTQPTDHLLRYFVQLDCYAGSNGPAGQGEAQGIASTVRGMVLGMRTEEFAGAVVTNVTVRGPRRLPDPDFNPARQRYILEAEIYVHS
jgi:hypothetical protein